MRGVIAKKSVYLVNIKEPIIEHCRTPANKNRTPEKTPLRETLTKIGHQKKKHHEETLFGNVVLNGTEIIKNGILIKHIFQMGEPPPPPAPITINRIKRAHKVQPIETHLDQFLREMSSGRILLLTYKNSNRHGQYWDSIGQLEMKLKEFTSI